MMAGRLPAHLEVAGLIRSVESAGGFATVIRKGEREAGTILILTLGRNFDSALWERMPRPDGTRPYSIAKSQDIENPAEFSDYCDRRGRQDPDVWIVEVDVPNPERFIETGEP